MPSESFGEQQEHPRWDAFRKTVKRIREGPPCYPRDIYRDPKIGLKRRTVTHNLKLGVHLEVFRKLDDDRYAWIDYKEPSEIPTVDEKVEAALSELEEEYTVITLIQISNITGLIPKLIEEAAFRLKSNYDLEIGEKPIERGISGVSIMQ